MSDVSSGVPVGGPVDDLLSLLRRGQVSASEVVAAHLGALREVDARTHAVAFFEDDRALADAARLDRAFAAGGAAGPLHGLPVTVKDWIDVAGFPCAGDTGAVQRRPRRPPRWSKRRRSWKARAWRGPPGRRHGLPKPWTSPGDTGPGSGAG